jgi:hypothetical protein
MHEGSDELLRELADGQLNTFCKGFSSDVPKPKLNVDSTVQRMTKYRREVVPLPLPLREDRPLLSDSVTMALASGEW